MELNFGLMSESAVAQPTAAGAAFRLAILGDFSAAANRARLETGEDLARRKPLRVDVDNIDQVIERLNIAVSLPMAEGAVELAIAAMDDFHPDQIYEKVELFSAMADLRRRLTSKSGFPAAAAELAAWRAAPEPAGAAFVSRRPRGATVPVGGKLSDFAALVGRRSAPESAAEVAVDELIKSVVRPYIKAKDPQQAAALGAVDSALAVTMRNVLHHPDLQTLEALWRSVDLLTRRIETSTQLQIVLYDVSAEEFAADLAVTDALEETGLYKLLIEQPALDANQGALSAIIGAYVFDQTPPQAELLGRIAKLAARANAPFISSISPDFLDTKPDDVHPLITQAWNELRALEEASFLALVTPRYLLRQPYGRSTDPISAFDDFEEFTRSTGLKGMLWGNPAIVAALMLAQSFAKQGAKMSLGSIMSAGDMPYYFYVDDDGEQTALPCTERLMGERAAARISAERFIALLAVKGRPEVRLGSFTSLAGCPLRGRWPMPAGSSAPAVRTKETSQMAKTRPRVDSPAAVGDVAEEEPPKPAAAAPKSPAAAPKPPAAAPPPKPAAAPAAKAAPAPAEETGDAELDKLLAGLQADTESDAPAAEAGEDEGMDPELAKLLKGM